MLKKYRENVLDFIFKRKEVIFFIIITIIAIYVRTFSLDFVSGDMSYHLKAWYEQIKAGGGFSALKNNISNYNVPYLVILAILTYIPIDYVIGIKIVSIIFDFVLAISSMILVRKLLRENPNKKVYSLITYGIILILPTIVLNSSCWGQCDAIYSSFIIISLIFLIEEKYFRSFVFLGISFAFKLQFIFVLPAYFLIYLNKRKFPIIYFFIIIGVNLILCMPAIIAGRPFMDVMKIYSSQVNEYESNISMNSVSIYNIILETRSNDMVYKPNDSVKKIGLMTTISFWGIVAFISMYNKKEYNKKDIISLTLWAIMICTFLLPNMHDRYYYLIDILSVIYFIVNKDKLHIPILMNIISMCLYSNFLFGKCSIPLQYLSIAYFVMLIIFSKDVFEKYLKIEEVN